MIRFALALVMMTLAALAVGPSTASALEIRVLGESKIVADVTAAGTVAQVSGILTDDLDRPLPRRELRLYVDQADSGDRVVDTNLLTDGRGQFRFQEELPPGEYVIHAIFSPTESFEGSAVTESIRLEPAPFDVRVVAPEWVLGRDQPVMIYAQGRAGSVGVQGIGIVAVNGRRVGDLQFGPSGRGSLDVADFVEPGENIVVVTIPGSQHRDAARAEASLHVSFDVTFEARSELRIERLSRGVAIYGSVEDSKGPVEGARIQGSLEPLELSDPEAELPDPLSAAAVTDDDGEFVIFFDSTKVPDGVWSGAAVLVPPVGDSIQRDAGTIERDTAVQRALFDILGFLVVLIGALALASGLFERVRRAIAEARRERARRAEERAVLQAEEKIVPVFLEPREVETNEPPPTSKTIGGIVWDVWQDEPLPGAELELEHASGERRTVRADPRGHFRFDDLTDGTWSLTARSSGHMPGHMECSVPHDGRLGRFRVDLVAVPLKVRRLYQTVVARDPRGGDYWGRLSPSEIEDAVADVFGTTSDIELERLRRRVLEVLAGRDEDFDAEEVVAALTRIVEESYYSGRSFDERVFFIARDLALRLRAIAAHAGLLLAASIVAATALLAPVGASAQPLADYDPGNEEWNGLSDFVALADALGAPMKVEEVLDWDAVETSEPLIFVYPSQQIDVESFARFVIEGGRVIIADDFGKSERLLERLEITRVAPSPGNLPHENFVDGNSALPELRPRGRHPLLPGVERVVANHPSVISNIGGPVVSFDAGGGLVYDMNLGKGKVIVVSDASLFINQMLGVADNSDFARNAITYACDDPLTCQPRLFTKTFEEKGSYGIGADNAEIHDSVESFNEALAEALEKIPAREFLYWVSLLIAIGLGAYLVTVFPLRGTRRYSAYVTDFIGSIPEPQAEFDWNLSRFGGGSRTMNYALPMAILKEHFEELFLSAFDMWPSKASERPGIQRLGQMYVERFGKNASAAEKQKMEDEAIELLATFAQLPPRNRVFLEDDARFRDVDMLKCHRRAMAILERMDLKDEYERRTRRTRRTR